MFSKDQEIKIFSTFKTRSQRRQITSTHFEKRIEILKKLNTDRKKDTNEILKNLNTDRKKDSNGETYYSKSSITDIWTKK